MAGVRLAVAVARCEVDVMNAHGRTALHWASRNGNVECVETLLAEGADARATSKDGQTAMHMASRSQLVAVLQAAGADVNAKDKRGRTTLHSAVAFCLSSDMASTLLAAGAKARAADKAGKTALHGAAASHCPGTVRVLLAADADVSAVDDDGQTCLHEATRRGPSLNRLVGVKVRTLLRAGAKAGARDKRGQTPLHHAARHGILTPASLLLGDPLAGRSETRCAAADAPPTASAMATPPTIDVNAADQDGQTALHLAALGGHPQMVALLLRHGAHPTPVNVPGGTPLTAAAALGRTDIVTQLPAEHPAGAVSPPAHEAAAARRPAMLSLPPIAAFLPAGDEAGNTVLHVGGRRADRPTVVAALGDRFPAGFEDDLRNIHQPLDWWGLNWYTPSRVIDDSDPDTGAATDAPFPATRETVPGGAPLTDIGWEIAPDTLTGLLRELDETLELPPCWITENGACCNTGPDRDGRVDDAMRVDYLEAHLHAVADAIDAGCDIRGYFAWSLLDNFEWAEGYRMRFGLVHVDYPTQTRTVKASGERYREIVTAHRERRG